MSAAWVSYKLDKMSVEAHRCEAASSLFYPPAAVTSVPGDVLCAWEPPEAGARRHRRRRRRRRGRTGGRRWMRRHRRSLLLLFHYRGHHRRRTVLFGDSLSLQWGLIFVVTGTSLRKGGELPALFKPFVLNVNTIFNLKRALVCVSYPAFPPVPLSIIVN